MFAFIGALFVAAVLGFFAVFPVIGSIVLFLVTWGWWKFGLFGFVLAALVTVVLTGVSIFYFWWAIPLAVIVIVILWGLGW